MKQFCNYLLILLLSILLYSSGYGQNYVVSNQHGSAAGPQSTDDLVVIHYDGDNYESIGDGGTTYIGGARFSHDLLVFYTNSWLQAVQFYYAQPATGLTILIYDAGTEYNPGALLYSQPLNLNTLTVGDWNEILLDSFVGISGEDLWICLQVEDATGVNYSFGCDAGPAAPDGDWVNDSGTWQHLTFYGLDYNWNIRGVLVSMPCCGPVVFEDNFDYYTAGQQLACQNPTDWTTWNLNPCDSLTDAYITGTRALSGANSLVITYNNDEVHYWEPETLGVWEIDLYTYIPSGKTGYFNTLSKFIGVQEWGLEVYFNPGGVGSINAGGVGTASFTYTYDAWVLNKCIIDLENDMAQYWYNGDVIQIWQWTQGANGSPISLSLAANDFCGTAVTDEMYVDDYQLVVLDTYYVPTELTSFTAIQNASGQVELNWQTATETNNDMFIIERKGGNGEYGVIGYVKGAGTTTEKQAYSFVDNNVIAGIYTYRLKQVDFSGRFEYLNEVKVIVTRPDSYNLAQNYPNPFNPSTTIEFSIKDKSNVKLTILNVIGEEVAVLLNEEKEQGYHKIEFNTANLPNGRGGMPSGVYFYQIKALPIGGQSGGFVQTKKMILLK